MSTQKVLTVHDELGNPLLHFDLMPVGNNLCTLLMKWAIGVHEPDIVDTIRGYYPTVYAIVYLHTAVYMDRAIAQALIGDVTTAPIWAILRGLISHHRPERMGDSYLVLHDMLATAGGKEVC